VLLTNFKSHHHPLSSTTHAHTYPHTPTHLPTHVVNADKAVDGEVVATMSEDDPLHSGVEFSDPTAAIPEQVRREGGRER